MVYHGVSKDFANGADDLALLKQVRVDSNLPNNKILVGLVGSIEKRKGHDLLLQAVCNMREDARKKVHIVFVGSDKTEGQQRKRWLYEIIEEYGLKEQVTQIEYTTRVKDLYQVLDISTLPSRQEGFPMVVIEAMLAKCCVIRSNTEGAYEQIEQGVSGYVFENENVLQFSKYLEAVILDEDLRKKLANNAHERALKYFTNDIMARNTYKVYETILSKGK